MATFAKNGTSAEVFTFSPSDFLVESGDAELDSIVFTSLPDSNAGVLTLDGVDIAVGDAAAMSAVSGLRFYPNTSPTVASTQFTFTPIFADGSAGEDVAVGLYLLTAQNNAPIAENLNLVTYKNVALTGQFSAVDPEGDILTFRTTFGHGGPETWSVDPGKNTWFFDKSLRGRLGPVCLYSLREQDRQGLFHLCGSRRRRQYLRAGYCQNKNR